MVLDPLMLATAKMQPNIYGKTFQANEYLGIVRENNLQYTTKITP